MSDPIVTIYCPGEDGEPGVEYRFDDPVTVSICRLAAAFAAQKHADPFNNLGELADDLIAGNSTPWSVIDSSGSVRISVGDAVGRLSVRPPRRRRTTPVIAS